jgi:hypothetical protein
MQVRLPDVGRTDRLGDLVGVGVLQQVSGRSGFERAADLRLLDETRHRDHLDVGPACLISRVAVIPSISGIARSIRITSGRPPSRASAPSFSIAWLPPLTSPITSMSSTNAR